MCIVESTLLTLRETTATRWELDCDIRPQSAPYDSISDGISARRLASARHNSSSQWDRHFRNYGNGALGLEKSDRMDSGIGWLHHPSGNCRWPAPSENFRIPTLRDRENRAGGRKIHGRKDRNS